MSHFQVGSNHLEIIVYINNSRLKCAPFLPFSKLLRLINVSSLVWWFYVCQPVFCSVVLYCTVLSIYIPVFLCSIFIFCWSSLSINLSVFSTCCCLSDIIIFYFCFVTHPFLCSLALISSHVSFSNCFTCSVNFL